MASNRHILSKPFAFLQRDFRIAASYRLQFITQFLSVFLTTCSFFLVSKMLSGQEISFLEPYGGNYFPFVLIGVTLTDYLTISTDSFASEIRSAQMVGTLESLLVTPTSLNTILLSSFTYKLISTSFRIALYFLLGIFVFGIEFQDVNLFLLALTFFLTLLPFIGLGLLSAAFIIVFKQGSPISMLMAMSSGLLSGVLYPVTVLPLWLKPLSVMLPITHGLEAIRQILLQGAVLADIADRLFYLSLFSIILLSIGLYSIHKALHLAKQEGSLLHY
jgi:ABC-2 type transport system permease protein